MILIGLVLVAGVGGGLFVLLSGDGDGPEKKPIPEFHFEIGKVAGVAVEGDAPQRKVENAGQEIAAVLDRLYQTGFVDPREWKNGTFPALPSLFAGKASQRATEDLDHLSLGNDASKIERVEPQLSRMRISVLLDPASEPYAAVAQGTFRAKGTTKGGRGLDIFHVARYILRQVEGSWMIVGYDVEGNVDTRDQAAEATP